VPDNQPGIFQAADSKPSSILFVLDTLTGGDSFISMAQLSVAGKS